jgi:hypothetical protein
MSAPRSRSSRTGTGSPWLGRSPGSATGIAAPSLGSTTTNEIVIDVLAGAFRARYYRDGALLATLTDTGGATPDFSSVGFQAVFTASAVGDGAAPVVHVDDVSVADGYQGV